MNPEDAEGYPVEPTESSRRGAHYIGPGGQRIQNHGRFRPGLMLRGGRTSQVNFNAAKVRKPLLAVSSVCDKGNWTLFGPDGGYIVPMDAENLGQLVALINSIKGKIELVREHGVYHLPAWVMPHTPHKAPFQGRGA